MRYANKRRLANARMLWRKYNIVLLWIAIATGLVMITMAGMYIKENSGYVYAMVNREHTKLGLSKKPLRREQEHNRTYRGTQLVKQMWVPNMRKAEAYLLKKFNDTRLWDFYGQEWVTAPLRTVIKAFNFKLLTLI